MKITRIKEKNSLHTLRTVPPCMAAAVSEPPLPEALTASRMAVSAYAAY
jgi:hypothetical protein